MQAVSFNYLRREWTILDEEVAADFKVRSSLANHALPTMMAQVVIRLWCTLCRVHIAPTSVSATLLCRGNRESCYLWL